MVSLGTTNAFWLFPTAAKTSSVVATKDAFFALTALFIIAPTLNCRFAAFSLALFIAHYTALHFVFASHASS